jgi:hypothetical protein
MVLYHYYSEPELGLDIDYVCDVRQNSVQTRYSDDIFQGGREFGRLSLPSKRSYRKLVHPGASSTGFRGIIFNESGSLPVQ